MGKSSIANTVHYKRRKSKLMTKRLVHFVSFVMVHSFNISPTVRLASNTMLDLVIPMQAYTDSPSLYICLLCVN